MYLGKVFVSLSQTSSAELRFDIEYQPERIIYPFDFFFVFCLSFRKHRMTSNFKNTASVMLVKMIMVYVVEKKKC